MDHDTYLAALQQMQLLEQEWLEELARDEAARVEFESWLASTHRTNINEPQQSD